MSGKAEKVTVYQSLYGSRMNLPYFAHGQVIRLHPQPTHNWKPLGGPSARDRIAVSEQPQLQLHPDIYFWVMKEILANTVNSIMESGFTGGEDLYFRQSQRAYYLGDHDAVRAAFSSKGSAGLRPCTLCKNIVKNKSGIVEIDPCFMELGATENFDLSSDAEIFND